MAKKNLADVTAKTVVAYLKEAHKQLVKLENLTPRESAKITGLVDKVRGVVDNFDRVKDEQYLNTLIKEKAKLAKQGSKLDQEIERLQNKLG